MNRIRNLLSVVIVLVSPMVGLGQQSNPKLEDKRASKAASHVKVKHDKSRGLTTVTLKTMAVSSAITKEVSSLGEATQLDLNVSFTHPGEQLTKPADVAVLKFKSTSRYPVYQRGQNLMAVLDDERAIPLDSTAYSSNSQTFYTEEILTATIPYEIMRRITAAKSVKLFLGPREIKLKEAQLEDLREITRRMAP